MFVKNILKAFDPQTQIEVYLNDMILSEYGTVEEFMNSGLMTYMEVDSKRPLTVEDGMIVIYL